VQVAADLAGHPAIEFDLNAHELVLDQAAAKAKGLSFSEWVRIMLGRAAGV
jgi:hypothetical protein